MGMDRKIHKGNKKIIKMSLFHAGFGSRWVGKN